MLPVILADFTMPAVWIWLVLNTAGLCLLAVVQYVTLRQIGIMLGRLAPLGARSVDSDGPRAGEVIESQMAQFRSQTDETSDIVFLFVSKSCSICKEIRRSAEELSQHWNRQIQIALIYDDPSPTDLPGKHQDGLWFFYGGRPTRELLGIDGVPFGIRVDSADRVLGKGLVNTISHIESLLELNMGNADWQPDRSLAKVS